MLDLVEIIQISITERVESVSIAFVYIEHDSQEEEVDLKAIEGVVFGPLFLLEDVPLHQFENGVLESLVRIEFDEVLNVSLRVESVSNELQDIDQAVIEDVQIKFLQMLELEEGLVQEGKVIRPVIQVLL